MASKTGIDVRALNTSIVQTGAQAIAVRESTLFLPIGGDAEAICNISGEYKTKRADLKAKSKIFKKESVHSITLKFLKPLVCVYHIVMEKFEDEKKQRWFENMGRTFMDMMKKADKKGITSIACSLLGSGKENKYALDTINSILGAIVNSRPRNVHTVFLVTSDKNLEHAIRNQYSLLLKTLPEPGTASLNRGAGLWITNKFQRLFAAKDKKQDCHFYRKRSMSADDLSNRTDLKRSSSRRVRKKKISTITEDRKDSCFSDDDTGSYYSDDDIRSAYPFSDETEVKRPVKTGEKCINSRDKLFPLNLPTSKYVVSQIKDVTVINIKEGDQLEKSDWKPSIQQQVVQEEEAYWDRDKEVPQLLAACTSEDNPTTVVETPLYNTKAQIKKREVKLNLKHQQYLYGREVENQALYTNGAHKPIVSTTSEKKSDEIYLQHNIGLQQTEGESDRCKEIPENLATVISDTQTTFAGQDLKRKQISPQGVEVEGNPFQPKQERVDKNHSFRKEFASIQSRLRLFEEMGKLGHKRPMVKPMRMDPKTGLLDNDNIKSDSDIRDVNGMKDVKRPFVPNIASTRRAEDRYRSDKDSVSSTEMFGPGIEKKAETHKPFKPATEQCTQRNISEIDFSQLHIGSSTETILEMKRDDIVEPMLDVYRSKEIVKGHIKVHFKDEIENSGANLVHEMLATFWNEVMHRYWKGEDVTVPSMSLGRSRKEQWKFESMGRILSHTAALTSNLPCQISRSALTSILLEQEADEDTLLSDLILYVTPGERKLIEKALKDLNSMETQESEQLLDFFSQYEMGELPKRTEIRDQLLVIAKEILIAAPEKLYKLIRKGIPKEHLSFWKQLTVQQISQYVEDKIPTAGQVIAKLKTASSNLKPSEERVFYFLQQFLKSLDKDGILQFLLYVTGSTHLPMTPIRISFSITVGEHRRLVAHTCSKTLELSSSYNSVQEFKREFRQVLCSSDCFQYTLKD